VCEIFLGGLVDVAIDSSVYLVLLLVILARFGENCTWIMGFEICLECSPVHHCD